MAATTRRIAGEPGTPEPRGLVRWLIWLGALVAVTAAMLAVRTSLGAAHVVLAYLLLVLGASARVGRVLGLTISALAFGCFNFFFVPPYHTFAVAAPLDWLVLGAFLITSAVAAQLLARAKSEAAEARLRAAEVDRLSALGVEALNAARAEDALAAVADVIRASLDVARCEVYLRDASQAGVTMVAPSGVAATSLAGDATDDAVEHEPGARAEGGPEREGRHVELPTPRAERLFAWVGEHGQPAAVRTDGSLRFGDAGVMDVDTLPAEFDLSSVRALLLPLRVRDRTVGVLALAHEDAIALDAPRRRLLRALSYYAALGAERVRLAAEAEHAEALREADRLKDALLASVSHDLRTPLTTIKALAHAMGSEGDERAVTVEEEADRLNRFVADLLDLSRLAGGALSVVPELNAAEDLLGAALQRVSGAAGERRIDVSLDPSEPLLVGRFDFTHALRILVNLIENALKYSPPDSPVEVAARREGAVLAFVVEDRGPGVAAAERERIFEPFYRPDGSPSDTGGAGLGLSIARRLAQAQGGTVEFEPRPGGGSRFALRLPAADLVDLERPEEGRPDPSSGITTD
jgi:two-component system sensor histidine kinase KdpD